MRQYGLDTEISISTKETIDLIRRSTRQIDTKSAPGPGPGPATALNTATVEANGATMNTAPVKATQDC